jgi:ABC-type Zn uptake system ZnuABC Zn-binding protein ZnuA
MKVNFNTILSVLALTAFALGACSPAASQPASGEPDTPKVLVVETFLAEIAQNVAGERVKVESLIPLGMDPHAFEPTPQDVQKIAESNLLILNGAGFEEWAAKTLENAGGQRQVIEASAGLTSRSAREGEVAEMSEAELGEAMCAQAGSEQAQAVTAGADSASAAELPAEAGLFTLKLAEQTGGTFAGYIRYATDEAGDFQMVTGAGTLKVQKTGDGAELEIEKALALACAPLARGNIIELEKDGQYILSLTGFTSQEVSLLIGPAGGHHHHEGDPHFWLDPNHVIKYAENIRDGLIAADPGGKEVYTQNAAAYIAKLTELDGWIKTQVEQIPAERRLIVTNHESFGYFADRYGFKIIGTIVPSVSSSAAPSAQQLARLIDHIKETGAIAIFLETGASPQLAEQVSAETGVKVVNELYSHSITEAGGKAPTYIDMMKYNVNAIVEALK